MARLSQRLRSPKSWKRRTKILAIVVVVALIAAVATTVWLVTRSRNAETETTTTTTAKAAKNTYNETVSATGTLAPQNQSYLSFRSQGTINSVKVAVGDTVTKGEVLATQDTTSLSAALTEAQASVDSANSSLTALEDSSSSTDEEITAASSRLASAKTKLVSAQADVDGATMTSPIAGVVAEVNIATGDSAAGGTSTTVGPGSTASTSSSSGDIVVVDTSTWQVTSSVGMSDVSQLKKGLAVEIVADGSTETLKGTLASIDIVASSSSSGTASFPISVLITGSPTGLYIGGSADLTIILSSVEALTVPTGAVTTENGQAYVTVRANGTDTRTEVTVGKTYGTSTEITKGISEGTEVVVTTTSRSGYRSGGTGTPGANGSAFPGGGQMPEGMPTDGGQNGFPGGGAGGMPTSQQSR